MLKSSQNRSFQKFPEPMKTKLLACMLLLALAHSPSHAINAKYADQLERSGCTQVSEVQGCDITKSKAENTKAGFVIETPASSENVGNQTPYAGQWVAIGSTGSTVANIRINKKEQVWVNDKQVKSKRSDGALVFKQGFITYTIQGDRRLKGEDTWSDSNTASSGWSPPCAVVFRSA